MPEYFVASSICPSAATIMLCLAFAAYCQQNSEEACLEHTTNMDLYKESSHTKERHKWLKEVSTGVNLCGLHDHC